jgi:3-phosphoshikimate 1-carboxyvinyltransferase
LNAGADVAALRRALERCGVRVTGGRDARVEGGRLSRPDDELDLGNSGTGVRLLAGLVAGAGISATLTGDASLRGRPMDRIVLPLRRMGAAIRARGEGERLPLDIEPAPLRPIDYELPVPSAQVKSCLLLAGLTAGVPVTVRERRPTRDHTERLLSAMGAPISVGTGVTTFEPAQRLQPLEMRVPGDFSSAAFLLGLAVLVPGLELELSRVGVNPGRTGLWTVLTDMGADLRLEARGEESGEPVADLTVSYAGRLRAADVAPDLAPALIDEVPLLAVVAAGARGTTRLSGLGELRYKESDRLRSIAEGLRAVGADARETDDGLEIRGRDGPFGGRVETALDHRIAMAFAVLGRVPGCRIELSETASISTSFPEFFDLIERALA